MPPHAYLYGLPYTYYRRHHIRRYGSPGTSDRYVAFRYRQIFGKGRDEVNLITAHQGNGCSITAIDRGHSVDTSMGFTFRRPCRWARVVATSTRRAILYHVKR
jgi:acetate kinase